MNTHEKIGYCSGIGLLYLSFMIALPVAASAQDWWSPLNHGGNESGKVHELQSKNNVYVVFEFPENGITPQPERDEIRSGVLRSLESIKGLKIVASPERADFAILVRAGTVLNTNENDFHSPTFSTSLDPAAQVSVQVIAVMRGQKIKEPVYRSRIVWEISSSNTQMEAAPSVRFALSQFTEELRKIRIEKR